MVSSLITVVVFISIFCLIYLVADFFKTWIPKPAIKKDSSKKKDRETIIRNATKKLSTDPQNYPALKELADLYYEENNYEKALPLYELSFDIPIVEAKSDQSENGLHYGFCALKLNKPEDAVKGLLLAHAAEPDNFEVNFTLGSAYAANKDFEKSAAFYKKAILLNPEYQLSYNMLAQSLFNDYKYREALPYIKQALDNEPDNKELLFSLARSFFEVGNPEEAQKIFARLRIDPKYGPEASLFSGEYCTEQNDMPQAITDYEIGLKHKLIDPDVKKKLQYNLVQAYLAKNDIEKAYALLTELNETFPNFKDVSKLYSTCSELHKNMNLQVYLIGPAAEFISLCKQISKLYFKKEEIKIVSIASSIGETEIVGTIKVDKWEDTVVLRFYRTTELTGELPIRELHAKVKDLKAGKGICFTAGTFSDEAKRYVDVRPINLVSGDSLINILNDIETKAPITPQSEE
ncbi:MAG: tetratricopeptide repeat protein [Treponemataceae bacterium]